MRPTNELLEVPLKLICRAPRTDNDLAMRGSRYNPPSNQATECRQHAKNRSDGVADATRLASVGSDDTAFGGNAYFIGAKLDYCA